MALNIDATQQQKFESLFANPSIDAMLGLTWQNFQDFVAHVFTCAGYEVENVSGRKLPYGDGVDLDLYKSQHHREIVARVEVRRYASDNLLTNPDIVEFYGKLELAGGIPGFMVTTSDFVRGADIVARRAKGKIQLINGPQLLRYIAYIGGSRLDGDYGGIPIASKEPISPSWIERGDALRISTQRPPRHTRILAVVNTKGGAAKTTTALNVGLALTEQHSQKVLLVDLDGMTNLTYALPRVLSEGEEEVFPQSPDTLTMADYLRGREKNLGTIPRKTRFKDLMLIPANQTMNILRLQFSGGFLSNAELRFVEDIRNITDKGHSERLLFDWIIIDTPAGQSFYSRAALAAADYILIPSYSETFAIQGIQETIQTIKTTNALLDDTAHWNNRVLGCLVTRWKAPRSGEDLTLASLRVGAQNEGVYVFQEPIPADDRIEDAHRSTAGGGVLGLFRLRSQMGSAAKAYRDFVKEMVKKCP